MTTRSREYWDRSSQRNSNHGRPSENTGNKQTYDETRVPPDDIGNQIDCDPIATFVHDGLGNSKEGEPTHLGSGVLQSLVGTRGSLRKRVHPLAHNPMRQRSDAQPQQRSFPPPAPPPRQDPRPARASMPPEVQSAQTVRTTPPVAAREPSGPRHIDLLKGDLQAILASKRGLPLSFAFASRAKPTPPLGDEPLARGVAKIKDLLEELLVPYTLFCRAESMQYDLPQRKCVVFFISLETMPGWEEQDVAAALRQTIAETARFVLQDSAEVLVALASGRDVVERAMHKLSASASISA
jgi:hypothetical protein